ncbi:GFA family protein [Oxalobacteraceae bacterium A2-2]
MKTYHGSCHCGAVTFEAGLDLARGTIKCNCSICAKGRIWSAIVPREAFRLLSGAEALAEYRFLSRRDGHYFCKHCGIRPYGTGSSPRWGDFYAVNLACLDGISDAELAAVAVTYLDGKHDNWASAPAETRHL